MEITVTERDNELLNASLMEYSDMSVIDATRRAIGKARAEGYQEGRQQELETMTLMQDCIAALLNRAETAEARAKELEAALQAYMAICGNTAYQISRESAQELYARGGAALAQKGGANDG
jgi:flagellar biosynthesis/type III secretory pathway protein FliH